MIIDLTTEEEYATFPLTQLSEKERSTHELNEKESIAYEREMYNYFSRQNRHQLLSQNSIEHGRV